MRLDLTFIFDRDLDGIDKVEAMFIDDLCFFLRREQSVDYDFEVTPESQQLNNIHFLVEFLARAVYRFLPSISLAAHKPARQTVHEELDYIEAAGRY